MGCIILHIIFRHRFSLYIQLNGLDEQVYDALDFIRHTIALLENFFGQCYLQGLNYKILFDIRIELQVTNSARILNNLDEAKLKGMILKMVEELFQTGNLIEIKRVFALVLVELMVKILGKEEILDENQTHKKKSEESPKNGQGKEQIIFMEDELIRTMGRRNREGDGMLWKPLAVEAFGQSSPEVGPRRKSVEKEPHSRPSMQSQPLLEHESRVAEMGP